MPINGKRHSPDVALVVAELRASRIMQGVSINKLGQAPGMSERSLQSWERGDCQPHLDTLQAWARALGYEVTIDIKIKGE